MKIRIMMTMAVLLVACMLGGTALAAVDDSVATGSVNVRSGPGTSYEKLGQLSKNQSISIEAVNEDWGQITYQGVKGFVSLSYVRLEKAEYPAIEAEAAATDSTAPRGSNGTDYGWKERRDYAIGKTMGVDVFVHDEDRSIATADCTVYAGPGDDFKQLGQIKKDGKMSVIALFGDWMQICYGDDFGFVHGDNVKLFSPRVNYRGITGLLVRKGNIYDQPSTSGKIVRRMNKGHQPGPLIEIKDGWATCLGWNERLDYIPLKDLNFHDRYV